MSWRTQACLALAAALTAGALAAPGALAGPYSPDSLLPNQGSGDYDVRHYDIDLACNFTPGEPSCLMITATTVITAEAEAELAAFSFDFTCRNGEATAGLAVSAVLVDGTPASFACENDDAQDRHKLAITPSAPVSGTFQVAVAYSGAPEKYRFTAGFTMDEGWMPVLGYNDTADGGAVGIGQPNGNFTWFPNNTTPLDKATYTTALTVPNEFKGVGIGELSAKTAVGEWATKWVWTDTLPTESFLAVAAIGEFNEHVDSVSVSWTELDGTPQTKTIGIRAYGDPEQEALLTGGAQGRLAVIKEVLQWGSQRFGRYEPSWAGYIQKYVGAGWALEILGRPFYSSPYHMYDAVLVHEFAHQWAGDSVSVADWKDLWLAEGYATYAEWLWVEDHGGQSALAAGQACWTSSCGGSSMWTAKVADPERAQLWGSSSYEGGGVALAALRAGIGDAAFDTLTRRWFCENRNSNASTADFIALAREVSGLNLDAWAADWLYSTGKPSAFPDAESYPPAPEPTPTAPEPTETAPEPTETHPEPTETNPEPTETAPEPTETNPEPTETNPEPTGTQPEPTGTGTEPTGFAPNPSSTRTEGGASSAEPAASDSATASDSGTPAPAAAPSPSAQPSPAGWPSTAPAAMQSAAGIWAARYKQILAQRPVPKVSAKLTKTAMKRSETALLTVTVKSPGVKATGKVTAVIGKATRTTNLINGKAIFKIAKVKRGKLKVKARFLGSVYLKPKTSKTLTLRVR